MSRTVPQDIAAPHSSIETELSALGFYRQLDWLVTALLTLLVFTACVLSGALTIKASLLIAAGVFLVGIFVGRRIARVLELF